jgi:pimeloyl-ACP methyl ester carboxylesterase
MATLTPHEQHDIDRANASGRRPIVFVHGLWLLSSSWDAWRQLFEAQGYTTLAPGWPDDPDTVEEAKQDPEVFAHKRIGQVTDHYADAIRQLTTKPAIVGHSFGGLIAQRLAGEGVAVATVAISPAGFRGVLPLPLSALKSASPVLANPLNVGRAVPLTFEQFRYAFGNAIEESEARELYERNAVPAPGKPLFQAAAANLNPWTEDRVNVETPERGPLLLMVGEQDHIVPPAVVAAAYQRQQKNAGITEYRALAGRGHSLTIDHGWREVADIALAFIAQHGGSIGSPAMAPDRSREA